MHHYLNSYTAEKIWEYEQIERDRKLREGYFIRRNHSYDSLEQAAGGRQRGLLQRWFGIRRSDTSMK